MAIQSIGSNIFTSYQLPLATASSQPGVSSSPSSENARNVSTYDFTNMTPPQMLQTVNSLIKSGRMSVMEASSLAGMTLLAGASELTQRSAQANQPMDFIAALKRQISYSEQTNNAPAVEYGNMSLHALQRLQGTPSMVDVSA
jgi:hypothetical protein